MKRFSSRVSFEHICHAGTSHILVTYFSCNGRRFRFKIFFFFFFQNIYLQYASLVAHNFENHLRSYNCGNIFFFKVNFEEDLLPPEIFESVNSSEALIQRWSLMKYGLSIGSLPFKTALLNIFGKFIENISDRAHVQYSYELPVMPCRK